MDRIDVQQMLEDDRRDREELRRLRTRIDARRQAIEGLKIAYPHLFEDGPSQTAVDQVVLPSGSRIERSPTVQDALRTLFSLSSFRGRWLSPPELKANLEAAGTLPEGLKDPEAAIRKALRRMQSEGLIQVRARDGRTNEFAMPDVGGLSACAVEQVLPALGGPGVDAERRMSPTSSSEHEEVSS